MWLWNHPSHDLDCVSIMLPSLLRRAILPFQFETPVPGAEFPPPCDIYRMAFTFLKCENVRI
jgi:hypothetical protein